MVEIFFFDHHSLSVLHIWHFEFCTTDREFIQLLWSKSKIVETRVFDAGFQPNFADLAAIDHGLVCFSVGVTG